MTVRDDSNKPLDPMLRWREESGAIYDLVSGPPRVIFKEAGFYPTVPEMVERIQREAGLNVSGYLHIMDTDSIRHIIKSHGASQEAPRGQVPLVREDFLLVPEILAAQT